MTLWLLLLRAAARLGRPQLAACVHHWASRYRAEVERASKLSLEEQLVEANTARNLAESALATCRAWSTSRDGPRDIVLRLHTAGANDVDA